MSTYRVSIDPVHAVSGRGDNSMRAPNEKTEPEKTKVLVTGATGFLGGRLVEMLVERRYRVRALARKSSSTGRIKPLGIEVIYGDVADVASLKPAFQDIDVVVHAAADTGGSEHETRRSTIQGTANVLRLCEEFEVGKLIHISSCSVYGVADYPENKWITEDSPLERYPERRGFYSFGKLEAEKLVLRAMQKSSFPIVCLRSGTIFGPGCKTFTPMMGFSLRSKLFAVIGMGGLVLPLVYLDNLVDAIIRAIEKSGVEGRIFNVVDPEPINKKEYAERLLKRLHPEALFLYVPSSLLFVAVYLQERLLRLLGRKPFLTRYRLILSQKNVFYDSTRIMKELEWKPPYSMAEAIEAVIAYEGKKFYPMGTGTFERHTVRKNRLSRKKAEPGS